MNKFFTILAVVFFLGQGEAFAQAPWLWWPRAGIGIGGYEAARVVAGYQAMIWSLSQQWPGPYQVGYPFQPIVIQQPSGPVVCTPKPEQHRKHDIVGGALTGFGVGLLAIGGARGAIGGGAAGTGIGLLVTNHEYDCRPLVQPVVQPAVSQQATQSQAPLVVEPAPPRLAGIVFIVRNENPATIVVEIPDGRRAVLAPRAQARVRTPNIRVFLVLPDGRGSFDEFEIDLRSTEDLSLPGWKIPASVKLKNP